jgi:hypothetical protein
MNYKPLLSGIALVALMLTSACSGKITIEITTPPPASLEVNQSVSITATLAHDSSSDSVNWSCTPVGACGTFTPPSTKSGAATVYMAPDVAGPVVITAASAKSPKKTAPADVTINAVANTSAVSGTYTFYANGVEEEENDPWSVAGSIVINGAMGTVTSGEQDYFDVCNGPNCSLAPTVFPADPITGGTINVGADGRGTLTLTPTSAPAETFSITLVNDKHILITQFGAAATASGSLDLQTAPTTVPTGGNAFALLDAADANAFGGVLTSNGAIVTASEADDDLGGFQDFDFAITGTFGAPDPSGRGTFTINDPNLVGSFEVAYYVVGPEAFRLIEFDGNGFAVGSMYGQGAGAFSAATLGSKFVFGQSGIEDLAFGAYAAAGQFTGNGTAALSAGVADANLGDGNAVKAGALTGSGYFVNPDGYAGITLTGANTDGLANFGVYLIDPAINVADPNSSSGGGGAVMVDLDTSNIGIGIVVPQATSPTFTGNFALSQNGVFQTATAFAWYGLLGQVSSDGTSKFSGLADYNEIGIAQTPAVTVTGTYTADANNAGRTTSTLTVNGAATPNNITIYQASSSLLLHVDTDTTTNGVEDLGTIGLGVFEQQQ